MSNEVLPGADPAPVADHPAPPAPVEQRYEYQPTDEAGRPMGAKQVIKYTTPEELRDKLIEQNTLLIRKLREQTRKARLGIVETDTIAEDAPRMEEPLTFEPKQLSPEDRFRLTRDLNDPEKFDEATDALFEAKLGVKPEALRQRLATIQMNDLQLQAKIASDTFVAQNPDYIRCVENFTAITRWMDRYKLAPTVANFQRAYDTLKADGLLVIRYEDVAEPPVVVEPPPTPVVEPVVEPVVVAEPTPTVEPPPPPAPVVEPPKRRIPTALSRTNSDDNGAPRSTGDDIVYEVVVGGVKKRYTGLQAINAMPADEYKRRINSDPTFAQKEAALEKEAAARRNRR